MTMAAAPTHRGARISGLDAELLQCARAPAFDKQDGEFSGWLHVAPVTGRRLAAFERRFCRLRKLVCTFYETENEALALAPCSNHIVVAVERVHERNKTLRITDHDHQQLLVHSALGADFEAWAAAFANAVRHTHVSKSPIATRQQWALLDENHRSPTATAASLADDDLDERTHTVWLFLHSPWWTLRRRRARRYFVLSGVTLSCFRVNTEGHVADFSVRLVACAVVASRGQPREVHVTSESGKTLRLSVPAKVRGLDAWLKHLHAALAARLASPELSKDLVNAESNPTLLGGFV